MRYHLGFFESDYDFGLKFDTEVDAALLRGKLIHKYFEEYPAFDLDRTLHEFEITDPILTGTLKQDLFETVQRVSGSEQLSEILKAAEFANEVPAMRQIGPDLITGTIDRMYRNRDGRWEIIDYKTNRISRKQVEVTALKYQLQLQVYALLLEGMHPGQEYYQVNLYFTHIDVLYPAVFTAADLQKCAARIGQVIEAIKNWDPYRRGAYPG
jgi:ATP-dependent helicase/nuclease subunit A